VTGSSPDQPTHRFVLVLSGKLEPGVALNAGAHMAAALVARAGDEARRHMSFVDYLDADGAAHPVSALSLVVLRARNSNQIRSARLAASGLGIPYVDFTASMTKDTYVEQMERTSAIREADLDYWACACSAGKRISIRSPAGSPSGETERPVATGRTAGPDPARRGCRCAHAGAGRVSRAVTAAENCCHTARCSPSAACPARVRR
jgi:hypothetical protein